tara:strand:- start:2281 stop:2415 length:135 start_codon:yes stop_codon:yes gene_type:complete
MMYGYFGNIKYINNSNYLVKKNNFKLGVEQCVIVVYKTREYAFG